MIDAVSNISVSAGATQKPAAQVQPEVRASQPRLEDAPSAPQPASAGTARIRVDNLLNLAIIEFRSTDTGDVVRQYPTEAQIQAFSRASEIEARNAQIEVATNAASPDQDVSSQAVETGAETVAPAPVSAAAAAPATAVNVTSDGASVPAYSSSSQVVTA